MLKEIFIKLMNVFTIVLIGIGLFSIIQIGVSYHRSNAPNRYEILDEGKVVGIPKLTDSEKDSRWIVTCDGLADGTGDIGEQTELKPGEAIVVKYLHRQELDFSKIYSKEEQKAIDIENERINALNDNIKPSRTVSLYEGNTVEITGDPAN